MADIEIKYPPFDKDWFKTRTREAVAHFENGKGARKIREKQLLNVLTGLFSHAYQKGRHDEKQEAEKRSRMVL